MMATAYRRWGKRAFDIALAGTATVCLSPVIATVAAAVAVRLGRPVLFRQHRPGKDGKPFRILKFRTMTDARGPDGRLLSDGERLPAFGKFLRSTSLDELPELINILRGEMSFVGPRPLLMQYLPRYNETQVRRHDVRPGLTGWAQVNGRNQLGWSERFEHDVWYVEHLSAALDVRILYRTFWLALRRVGIHEAGHATMPEFTGNGMIRDLSR
jgi:lipopolysaccharide/colanic/teichoic acid biosynthesis glycosyltransferase